MPKKRGRPKSRTKSRPSPSTKRSKGSTLTSKRASAHSLASELFSRSLKPKRSRHSQEAVVEGVSMWPALKPGFRLKYQYVDPEGLEPGDILVLVGSGRGGEKRWKVHRFLGRVGPLFLEAGDNAFSCALVEAGAILGKVVEARDWDGRPIPLPPYAPDAPRFRLFRAAAHSFVFAHELKDRALGRTRSRWLWRASLAYRGGLKILGLDVPVIPPK